MCMSRCTNVLADYAYASDGRDLAKSSMYVTSNRHVKFLPCLTCCARYVQIRGSRKWMWSSLGDGGGVVVPQPIRCHQNRLLIDFAKPFAAPTSYINFATPRPPPHVLPLHSSPLLPLHLSFLFVASMFSTTRSAASMAPRGWSRLQSKKLPAPPELTIWTAKPATALMPFRAGSAAFLSSSSSDRATMKTPATIPGNPGTPPPMKSARVEVPLPSQEGKKGAMQYALYVTRHRDYGGDMGGNKDTTRAQANEW